MADDESRSPSVHDDDNNAESPGDAVNQDLSDPGTDIEEEDDVVQTKRRRANGVSSSQHNGDEGSDADKDGDGDHGLFGSDDEEEGASPSKRDLDDSELDSGDDEGRRDRMASAGAGEEMEEFAQLDVDLARQRIPTSNDDELYLLRLPNFFGIDPSTFKAETFQMPTTDHHSKSGPSDTFSPYNTALRTVRWRRAPSDAQKIQSNARVLRWSDGSLTLQFASDPRTQYSMSAQALAPRLVNPTKPTPTSKQDSKQRDNRGKQYRPEDDVFTYLAAPSEASQVLRITNKITVSLQVQQAADAADDALEQLKARLAADNRGKGGLGLTSEEGGIEFVETKEDPELAQKKAELAEKERAKAQKKREAQEMKSRDRGGPRSGGKRHIGVSQGLTISGLEGAEQEGELGDGGGRPRKRAKPSRSRGEIISDDEEDYGRRVGGREDEYDEEDDFVAGSDEEEEAGEEDDDDIDEGIDLEQIKRNRGRPQQAEEEAEDAEGDAEGDPEDAVAASSSARGRRRVVDDEDEDD